MNIPDKVKIGGIEYKVIQTDQTLLLNGRECAGIIHYEETFIELSNKRDIQKIKETLCHEIVHGMSRERGLDWKDDDELYTEELGKALYSLIKDNPELFKEGDNIAMP